jgi:hypothetical protein
VMKYSFVVDYFWKVALWLRAITPNPDLIVEGNWVSVKQKSDFTTSGCYIDVRIDTAPTTVYRCSGGFYNEQTTSLVRTVNQQLTLTPPSAGKPLSFSQSVDIAALILGRITSGLRGLRL